jgi:hypothetical protein
MKSADWVKEMEGKQTLLIGLSQFGCANITQLQQN